jgi:hypothetical protein
LEIWFLPRGAEPYSTSVAGLNGQALHLVGTEAYPWRLRQGKPARHADHIFTHFGEDRRLMNWFVAADKCPKNAI